MPPKSSKSRPSVASALERVLRDVEPVREVAVESQPVTASSSSSRYFDPGDFADERSWWAKQLGRQA